MHTLSGTFSINVYCCAPFHPMGDEQVIETNLLPYFPNLMLLEGFDQN